jgi:CRISPR-associated endoribonuclease Cas6
MLISLIITLTTDTPAVLPAELGRASYAAALERVSQVDPELAAAIHAGNSARPLTCSGLMPFGHAEPAPQHPADSVSVLAGAAYCVRLTGLTERVSRSLLAGIVADTPATWSLHGQTFRLTGVICDAQRDAWTGQTTCEQLTAAALAHRGRLPRAVTLEFVSPTAFRSCEMQVPVPLPGLVFGSLVERWNAFSTVALDPGLRGFAEAHVAISHYHLGSRPMPGKNGALRIGGVGRVTYTALDDDSYSVAALNILADFALYSGAGVQTAAGMGQCRRLR